MHERVQPRQQTVPLYRYPLARQAYTDMNPEEQNAQRRVFAGMRAAGMAHSCAQRQRHGTAHRDE